MPKLMKMKPSKTAEAGKLDKDSYKEAMYENTNKVKRLKGSMKGVKDSKLKGKKGSKRGSC